MPKKHHAEPEIIAALSKASLHLRRSTPGSL
jgi:hypothetical protein